MMLADDISGRLLPPSIPYRFFATAAIFQALMWILVFAGADQVAAFEGGPGVLLGAVHSLTLGVLVMTAVGASVQLLPIATLQSFGSLKLCKAVWWILMGGTGLLVFGMTSGQQKILPAGATLTALALVIFAGQIGFNLARARDWSGTMGLVIWHGLLAIVSLVALTVLGMVLALNISGTSMPINHATTTMVHLVLACYGFLGMLVLGFSNILIPMFALSPAPRARSGYLLLGLITFGIVASSGGILTGTEHLIIVGVAVGLCGGGGHVWLMESSIQDRLRQRLDRYFILIRCGWFLLPISLALALIWVVVAAGFVPIELQFERLPALFGAVLTFGWLLTFLLGVLHRILPFLASMHLSTPGEPPPLLSSIVPKRLQQTHIALHLIALALLLAGITVDLTAVIQLASLSGISSAVVFAVIIIGVMKKIASGQTKQ